MPQITFGKYEVIARLATGGAASIFLARQSGAAGFNKLVVLKVLLPERAQDEDFVAMFLDEARLAARLSHPNCVEIYDLGRVRNVYYISMEYIFGETLWNLLATVTKLRTPLPATHVAAIVACVCDGLHHAHELKDPTGRPLNLVHRDVSPQNVMITFEGQTKVLDFGIAKAETGRIPTVAGIVKGKFSYMSPEQITGSPVDRRSDIYSLGIVLFECLASRRLYRGDTPEDIARLILEHRAPRLRDVVSDVPKALDAICAKALSRHPSKRYQTAAEMADAVREYLEIVRFGQTTPAIAKLVNSRFQTQIPERRQVYEGALAGDFDEAHLLKTLDASPVRYVDLFPDLDGRDGIPTEEIAENVDLIDDHGSYGLEQSTGASAPSGRVPSSMHEGPGWRVELGASAPAPAPISMFDGIRSDGGEVGDDSDRTTIDPDVIGSAEMAAALNAGVGGEAQFDADEEHTSVDEEAEALVAAESATQDLDSEQQPSDREQSALTATEVPGARSDQDRAGEGRVARSDTPVEVVPGPTTPSPPSRSFSGVMVGPASSRRGPSIRASSIPSVPWSEAEMRADSEGDWNDKTHEDHGARQVPASGVRGVAAAMSDSAEIAGDDTLESDRFRAPPVSEADASVPVFEIPADPVTIDPANLGPATGSDGIPVVVPATGASLRPQLVGAPPTEAGRRYTTAALLAAVGFGLAAGIIIGLVLARMFYGAAP